MTKFKELLERAKQNGWGVPEQIAHEQNEKFIAKQLAKFNSMTMEQMLDYLEIIPTSETFLYVNEAGYLCSIEKRKDAQEPADTLQMYGYAFVSLETKGKKKC